MKKFGLLFLTLGVMLLSIAMLPVQGTELQNPQAIEQVIDQAPVIYQASVLDTIWGFLKELDLSSIISLLLAGGFVSIIASVKKAKKEIMDVVTTFKEVRADGKITEAESEQLIKELTEAIEASTKLWYMVAGVFKRKKTTE